MTIINSSLEYKENLLYPELHNFFIFQKNIYKILPILDRKKNTISLSLIDFFVTNYSKKFNISYKLGKKKFDVFNEYKSLLKSHSKQLCDPFNRSGKIIQLEYEKDKKLETTYKQLNFLKWVIKNKILNYINDNLEEIKKIKKEFIEGKRDDKKKKIKGKGKEKEEIKEKDKKNEEVKGKKKRTLVTKIPKTIDKRTEKVIIKF